jgi:hypothetical protein
LIAADVAIAPPERLAFSLEQDQFVGPTKSLA